MFTYRRCCVLVVSVSILATISACSFLEDEADASETQERQVVAQLLQASGCEELLENIQNDMVAKIDILAIQMRDADSAKGYPRSSGLENSVSDDSAQPPTANAGSADFVNEPAEAGAASTETAAPSDAASGSSDQAKAISDGSETPTSGSPTAHSDTNVQVKGVDEPDIVKTDKKGEHIYLLHGRELFVINAWAPASTDVKGRLAIEGYPREMFIWEERALIFSEVVDTDGTLSGTKSNSASAEPESYDGNSSTAYTKITLVNIEQETRPREIREIYIKGSYLSARLHDSIARVIIQGGFIAPQFDANIRYYDIWGDKLPQSEIDEQIKLWRSDMIEQVRNAELSNWLPRQLEVVQGKLEPIEPHCRDYYSPSPALTDYGMTNIVAMDLSDDASRLGGATILGHAAEVYSSAKMLVLAHNDWSWLQRGESREQTALHRFDLSSTMDTKYIASGFVQGHVEDQFSIDERGGLIRVATELRQWRGAFIGFAEIDTDDSDEPRDELSNSAASSEPPQIPDNRVTTLKAVDHELVQVGQTDALGNEGEDIRSTRFVGDYAYVVTFRRTDPLIVVDLSDPQAKKPPVLGTLEIEGFSEYMHPIDESHLLTIGRSADSWGNATVLMLRIFDVSDPANPRSQWEHEYEKPGESAAETEHKAFNYYAERDLLAFPFVSYGSSFLSRLELFRVTLDEGFQPLGSVDHTNLLTGSCPEIYAGYNLNSYRMRYECRRPAPEVRRGVFISGEVDGQASDFIYSISYGGILVHDLNDLAAPVAEVSLPAIDPTEYNVYYRENEGVVSNAGIAETLPDEGPAEAPDTGTQPTEPAVAACGDGDIDVDLGEQCDGENLAGQSCESLTGEAGTLSCTPDCLFDLSACSASL
ncbi:MAG: beta-propeller domain-containing protein [Deltaproteobacteria bacterium]|nr:beta-propeller domain-containing protein [Deltaproteobacteria bacterium]